MVHWFRTNSNDQNNIPPHSMIEFRDIQRHSTVSSFCSADSVSIGTCREDVSRSARTCENPSTLFCGLWVTKACSSSVFYCILLQTISCLLAWSFSKLINCHVKQVQHANVKNEQHERLFASLRRALFWLARCLRSPLIHPLNFRCLSSLGPSSFSCVCALFDWAFKLRKKI